MAMVVHEELKKFIKKDRPMCTHCKMLGHSIDKCYKLHGYPHGFKPKFKGQANTNAMEGSDKFSDLVNDTSTSTSNLSASHIH